MKKLEIPADFPLPTNKSIWVLEQTAHENKTKSGIILPETVTGENAEGSKGIGIVYAIGPLVDLKVENISKETELGISLPYRSIQPGDKVMYNIYQNRGISIDGYFYIMMHESDIYSVLPDEDMIQMRGERIDRRRAAVERKKGDAGGA